MVGRESPDLRGAGSGLRGYLCRTSCDLGSADQPCLSRRLAGARVGTADLVWACPARTSKPPRTACYLWSGGNLPESRISGRWRRLARRASVASRGVPFMVMAAVAALAAPCNWLQLAAG